MEVVLNWSTGKDAAMAYYMLDRLPGIKVSHLLTTINEEYDRVVMHGVREALLDAQIARMGIAAEKIVLPASPSDGAYRSAMITSLSKLKEKGISAAAFGDIFLEDLRQYRETQLMQMDLRALFPLWGISTTELVGMIEDAGIHAMIVCAQEQHLGKDFLGRRVDRQLLADLPPGIDPCGENGEFHTFVYDAPFFTHPIPVTPGTVAYRQYDTPGREATGFYFLDLL